jgi:hypothetical protein
VKSRFHEGAAADLAGSRRYYNRAFRGLGDQFVVDTEAAVEYLEQFPLISGKTEIGGSKS